MAKECSCSAGSYTVLACSGGSNVGQITNEVAKKLDTEGAARFFCLAGIGADISGMIASVEGSDNVLVLDGCPVACAKLAMDKAGLDDYKYLVVTDLGIEKTHSFDLSEDDVEKVLTASRDSINSRENTCST